MEAITSNILHLGVIPSEEDFQRAARRGEGRGSREAILICKRIYKSRESNLGDSARTSCVPPPGQTISHEMISHMHKQLHIIWIAGFCPPGEAVETARESHPETQRSVSELDFVCEQSRTTQESVASVSELQPQERSETGSALL